MLTEDYLMRYLRIATAALAQLVGLKAAGLDQDALFLLDRSLEQILGLRIDLIRILSSNDLLKLLSEQERMDPSLLVILGDLFTGEADLLNRLGRPIDGKASAFHALTLTIEGWFAEGKEPEIEEKIANLVSRLGEETMPEEIIFNLFSYYREKGDDGLAFTTLDDLLVQSGYQADLMDLARDYFTALLEKSVTDLEQSGLSRRDVQTALDQLEES